MYAQLRCVARAKYRRVDSIMKLDLFKFCDELINCLCPLGLRRVVECFGANTFE